MPLRARDLPLATMPLVAIALAGGAWWPHAPASAGPPGPGPYVSGTTAEPAGAGCLRVTVRGELPDPAWRLATPSVETEGHVLTVTLRGARDPHRFAAQVLTPFRWSQVVSGLAPGRWTVRALGAQGTHAEAAAVVVSAR